MDPEILKQKEPFRQAVIDRLGPLPIDFAEQRAFIDSTSQSSERYSAAGVLLLLFFRENALPSPAGQRGEYCFHLIKRSARVAQPGDLSCPGGMLAPRLDAFLEPLIAGGCVPVLQGDAKRYVLQRQTAEKEALTLFLTGAIRESWEEIRLSPFNVQFLGALPCHSLILFRRTIFPLVGLVKYTPRYQPNREVERVIEIPLQAFFQRENYARLQVLAMQDIPRPEWASWEFPCFLHQDETNGREILWGATFHIILRLLDILFDFKPPDIRSNPVITRTLGQTYMTGTK